MGVLNVTADSFSDGGRYSDFESAKAHARAMVAAGAAIIDVGGESTRPGAEPVPLQRRAGLPRLCGGRFPLLVGLSRKSMLGKLLGRPVEDRRAGSLALATIAALRGARVIRCHDVAETRDAVAVAWAARTGAH